MPCQHPPGGIVVPSLAKKNLRVNQIHPGLVQCPFLEHLPVQPQVWRVWSMPACTVELNWSPGRARVQACDDRSQVCHWSVHALVPLPPTKTFLSVGWPTRDVAPRDAWHWAIRIISAPQCNRILSVLDRLSRPGLCPWSVPNEYLNHLWWIVQICFGVFFARGDSHFFRYWLVLSPAQFPSVL
jgi:hypothetical protein